MEIRNKNIDGFSVVGQGVSCMCIWGAAGEKSN